MNFSYCQYITKLPNLFTATPNIKDLNLRGCEKLVEVHNSVGCLAMLESWDLVGCIELQILPSCISMKSLKILSLFQCVRVKRLPDIPQEMENLKYLSLAHTSIGELPPSFRNLIGLERLELGSYFNSCHLPISIYELQHLRKLLLYGNVQFATGVGSEDLNLQESFVKFNELQFLLLKNSKFLQEIPKLPESIREVCASNCISLNSKSLRNLFLQVPLSLKVIIEIILVTFSNTLLDLLDFNFSNFQIAYSLEES